jgi:hypothetical protein
MALKCIHTEAFILQNYYQLIKNIIISTLLTHLSIDIISFITFLLISCFIFHQALIVYDSFLKLSHSPDSVLRTDNQYTKDLIIFFAKNIGLKKNSHTFASAIQQ